MQTLRIIQLRTQLHLFADEAAREVRLSSKAEAFARLAKSTFRSRFKLDDADRAYIVRVGLETIRLRLRGAVWRRRALGAPCQDVLRERRQARIFGSSFSHRRRMI